MYPLDVWINLSNNVWSNNVWFDNHNNIVISFRNKTSKIVTAKSKAGYSRFKEYGKQVFTHRRIYERFYNIRIDKGLIIDHIDRDPSNNRIENLRLTSQHINMLNTGKYQNNSSGYKGITFNKITGKFIARYQKRGNSNWVGAYDSALEAAQAYDKAIINEFGSNAITNKDLGIY